MRSPVALGSAVRAALPTPDHQRLEIENENEDDWGGQEEDPGKPNRLLGMIIERGRILDGPSCVPERQAGSLSYIAPWRRGGGDADTRHRMPILLMTRLYRFSSGGGF
jgi:hypothetical protein